MATILATATGNWSATGTWVGGVVPTTGDIAVLNNKTVTVDVSSITCSLITSDPLGGATAGGTLSLSLSSTAINADLRSGSGSMLTVGASKTVTGLGSVYGSINGTTTGTALTVNNATGTATCTQVIGGSASGNSYGAAVSAGTLTCTNIYGGIVGAGLNLTGGTVTCDLCAHLQSSKLAAVTATGGRLIAGEIRGVGFGDGQVNFFVTVSSTNASQVGAKIFSCGPRGQFPVSGPVRLISDASNTFRIPYDTDLSVPSTVLATEGTRNILAANAELLRTQT